MNYIGSKRRLSSFLKETITDIVGDLSDKVFCDLFAGTGIVGKSFKSDVKKVISNDLEYYSYVLNRNYIGNYQAIDYAPYIDILNSVEPKEGFIYKHYCLGSGSERNYFSDENGKKIDGVRQEIERYKSDEDLYFFLLASLIESADKIANTASVYGAFLKKLKKTALQPLWIEPALFETDIKSHEVHNRDSNELICEIEGDILYLDPPYNARQYGANYHILNTIALDDQFHPSGKTGMRDYHRSNYCKRRVAAKSFEELITNAKFEYIFLSYNNEGLMSKNTVSELMKKFGNYQLIVTDYKRFKADNNTNRNHKANSTMEYLHILQRR
ncbi:MAG: DNA adenine methylase [Epsilonproteobacteria bacterium]|nr:DNA adenine methylase [Campylobacterota bacterium]